MNWKEKAKRLKLAVPALYLCMRDRETPLYAKLLAGITVGYALSPIDLIPDFIPLLGYLDDFLLLPLLAAVAIKCIPKAVYERHIKESEALWENGKPKRWYYAVPVVLVWFAVLWLIVRKVYFD